MLILGGGAIALGLMTELLARIYHATGGGSSYALAGGRNVPQLPSPEEASSLSPALLSLSEAPHPNPEPREQPSVNAAEG